MESVVYLCGKEVNVAYLEYPAGAQQGAQAEPSPTLRPANCCAIVFAVLRSRFGRLSTALGVAMYSVHIYILKTDL